MSSFRKLLPLLKPYRRRMALVIFSAIVITAMNLINPWLLRSLIQVVQTQTGPDAFHQVAVLAAIMLVTYFFRAIFRYCYSYVAHVVAYHVVGDVRVAVYAHLHNLSARFFSDRQTGELIKRVIQDSQDLEPLIAHFIPDMTTNVLVLIGVGVILFSLNPTLALLTMLPMPLLALSNFFFGKRMRQGFRDSSVRTGILVGAIQDNLVGIKEIQLFTQEQREHDRVNDLSTTAINVRLYALKMQGILVPTIEFLTGLGMVLIVLYGGYTALGGSLKVEDLVAFALYLSLFYQPINALVQMNEMFHVALTAAHHLVEVLDIPPDIDDEPGATDPGRLRGEVVFNDVSFEYNDKVPTLHNISFTVHPGETLALVGPTGAGKTTIASLLPRFYDVASGTITIDGKNVRDMTVSGLRDNISMVLQDVFLFNGTVAENIRYSNPTATDDDIVRSAVAARAHEFIMALPEGYNTQIGERGVKLSGGQKQRLAIARAVLKNAPILILDEATSSVDAETEAEIQEALNELMKGRTSLVIAHRLSTIRTANQIVVLDRGRIVEHGRHEELVYAHGRYQRLHEANSRLN
jgi:ABC-type multidrug transport system fused ATPase/permease subunit